MRYDSKGENIICRECYSKSNVVKKESPSLPRQKETKKDSPVYNKYICKDCRYNFKFKEGSRQRLRCPFCGSQRIAVNRMTAKDLINDSMDPRYDS